jgi:putative phosphoribosyl transferase
MAEQMEDRGVPVEVRAGAVALRGDLAVPAGAPGVVLFAHGSGSGRSSPRNRYVAGLLRAAGLGTLLIDLLTPEEGFEDERTRRLRFDIALLTARVIGAADWLRARGETAALQIGCFGASTGAAAALGAAAARPASIAAVVSRGGRPDLAGPALPRVAAPTLLVVGGEDTDVIRLNREALAALRCPKELLIIPGATHLFEEPGTIELAAEAAKRWFVAHLGRAAAARQ